MTTLGGLKRLSVSGFSNFWIDQSDAEGAFHHPDGAAGTDPDLDIKPVLFYSLGTDADGVC
jgi:hypothetical protein